MAEAAEKKSPDVKKKAKKSLGKPLRLHVTTVNCSGKKRSGGGTSADRFGLVRDVIDGSDVVLLQEVSFKKKLIPLRESGRFQVADISGSPEVAALIKSDTFDNCEIKRGSEFQKQLDRISKDDYKNETLNAGRFIFTITDIGGEKFLFVSYHGQHTGATDPIKGVQLEMLCDLSNLVAKESKANHIIIGGDFNLAVDKVPKKELEAKGFTVTDDIVLSDRRSGKSIIDYFVVSDEIEIEKVAPCDLSLAGLELFKDSDGKLDEEKLAKCLDHDPIRLTFTVKPKSEM